MQVEWHLSRCCEIRDRLCVRRSIPGSTARRMSMDELVGKRLEAANLRDAYMYDADFIEQQYRVLPLGDLLAEKSVLGVTRLIELASFCSERLHTFVYSSDSVNVSTVRGATSLWYSIPQYNFINESPELSEVEFEP